MNKEQLIARRAGLKKEHIKELETIIEEEFEQFTKQEQQVKTNNDIYDLLLSIKREAIENGEATLKAQKQEFSFSTKLLKITNETKAKLAMNNLVAGTVLLASGVVVGTAYEAWMPYVQVFTKFLKFWN